MVENTQGCTEILCQFQPYKTHVICVRFLLEVIFLHKFRTYHSLTFVIEGFLQQDDWHLWFSETRVTTTIWNLQWALLHYTVKYYTVINEQKKKFFETQKHINDNNRMNTECFRANLLSPYSVTV